MYPGNEVRFRYAYYITCTGFKKDDNGNIIEIYGEYDPESKGGTSADARKVRGTIHWVSAEHAYAFETRMYDRLFSVENPDDAEEGKTFLDYMNPDSLKTITAYGEPALKDAPIGFSCQFERMGYFIKDKDSTNEKSVFNRTTGLKDSWAKQQQQ